MIVVGIDEAGYGPLLGPLVVSAVGLELPDRLADESLWDMLRASVSARVGVTQTRLMIADSKKLYRSGQGLDRLETASLAWLATCGQKVSGLTELLRYVCPQAVEAMAEYPWYWQTDVELPTAVSLGQVETHANALRRDLAGHRIRPLAAWVEVLPAGHYNRMVDRTRNKSTLLFGLATRLMQRATQEVGDSAEVRIVADRQGGRSRYARPLMLAFAGRSLAIEDESPERSAYRLTQGRSCWRVAFLKGGEQQHLPIALASIVSKYIRELFMGLLNRYWQAKQPGLSPTEGYYTDGKRFLRDLDGTLRAARVDRRLLVRSR
ncbi:MAG TPA: hypothetical protein VMZ31_17345 [Phycisphaerae bacterium]|nr:hypothetical protein [Phycisphaerae bacterium]